METIIERRLRSNGVTDPEKLDEGEMFALKACLFGQMVAAVQSTLNSYQSDLYHDADALRRFDFKPGSSFIYGWTGSHTSFGHGDDVATRSSILTFNDTVVKITVTVTENGTWGTTWEVLKGVFER